MTRSGTDVTSWERALELAVASRFIYQEPGLAEEKLRKWGYWKAVTIDKDNLRFLAAVSSKRLLVAFRGSANWANWFTNLAVYGQKDCTLGPVHPGFLDAFRALKSDVWAAMERLDPDGKREIWFTGHSLGGALAVLAASEYPLKDRIKGIHTFGQPRTGYEEFRARFDTVFEGRMLRFVYQDDPVPRVPCLAYVHTGQLVWFRESGGAILASEGEVRFRGTEEAPPEPFTEAKLIAAQSEVERAARQHNATRGAGIAADAAAAAIAIAIATEENAEDGNLDAVRGAALPVANHRTASYIAAIEAQITRLTEKEAAREAEAAKPPPALPGAALPSAAAPQILTSVPLVQLPPPKATEASDTVAGSLHPEQVWEQLPPVAVHVVWSRESNGSGICQKLAAGVFECLSHHSGLDPDVESGVGIPVYAGHHFVWIQKVVERLSASRPSDAKLVLVLLLDEACKKDLNFRSLVDRLLKGRQTGNFRSNVLLLPVMVDDSWKASVPADVTGIDRGPEAEAPAEKVSRVTWQVGVETARFLLRVQQASLRRAAATASPGSERVRIFVSYASADESYTGELARYLSRHPGERTSALFDVCDLTGGESLRSQLREVQSAAVTLMVRTDSYSLSPYCQEEVLNAKQAGIPMVSLYVLKEGKGRSFPYEANSLTLCASLPVDGNGNCLPLDDQTKADLAERCGWVCLKAWLHHLHFHVSAAVVYRRRGIGLPPQFLSRPPELLDFVEGPLRGDAAGIVLYADPPLSARETDLIRRAYPRIRLATPTTLSRETLSRVPTPPLDGQRIALALSPSSDLAESFDAIPAAAASNGTGGLLLHHLSGATEYLTLSLIRAGAELGYGARFGSKNYTALLGHLVAAHKRVSKSDEQILHSYFAHHYPAPAGYSLRLMTVPSAAALPATASRVALIGRVGTQVHLRIFDASRRAVFDAGEVQLSAKPQELAELKKLAFQNPASSRVPADQQGRAFELLSRLSGLEVRPRGPEEIEANIIRVDAAPGVDALPVRVQQALHLSLMRLWMAKDQEKNGARIRSCDARVVLGGRTQPQLGAERTVYDYVGRFPGQAEEAFQQLAAQKPVFVAGGFLGSAGQVALALCNELDKLPKELDWKMKSEEHRSFCEAYDKNRPKALEGLPPSLDQLWRALAEFGKGYFWGKDAAEDKVWTNGLTVAENRALFVSYQYDQISALVIKGLTRLAQERSTKPNPPLKVALFQGSIADALDVDAYAVLILGSSRLRGADAALDARLNGLIRHTLASRTKRFDEIIPVQSRQLSGDYVLPYWIEHLEGMAADSEGPTGWLKRQIRAGLESILARAAQHRIRSLAIVPLGANLGLDVCESAGLITDTILQSQVEGRIESLALCEIDPERFGRLRPFLEAQAQTKPGLSVTELPSQTAPIALPSFFLQFQEKERQRGKRPAKVSQLARGPRSACTVPIAEREIDWREIASKFAGGPDGTPPPFADHESLGAYLAEKVFAAGISQAALQEGLSLPWDILLDVPCSAVPFEMISFRPPGAEAPVRPALVRGIRRGLIVGNQPYHATPMSRSRYRALIISNPTGDLPGTEDEGNRIASDLVESFGPNSVPSMEVLHIKRKEATIDRVLEEIASGRYDFIHYAGHGNFDPDRKDKSGLKLCNGFLKADALQKSLTGLTRRKPKPGKDGLDAPHPPLLVILNACLVGRMNSVNQISLAQVILETGVGGFLGNRWSVGDSAAHDFALAIYSDLITGSSLGEAICRAREKLFDRKSPDWCNYAFYGSPEIRLC